MKNELNIEKMREEFEAFAAGHASLKQYAFDKYPVDGDEYDSIPLQGAWSAWQASRAALVIELPEQLMPCEVDHHTDLPLLQAGAVAAAIEAAGLKVNP